MSANTDRLALVAKIHAEAAREAAAESDAAYAALEAALDQEAADAERVAAEAAAKEAEARPVAPGGIPFATPADVAAWEAMAPKVVEPAPAPLVPQPVFPESMNSPEGQLALEEAQQVDATEDLPAEEPAS